MGVAPHLWMGAGARARRPRRRALTGAGPRAELGFSLIELLIAVAIIMIIIGVAIPSLRKIRQNTTQTATAANLKTLSTVLTEYATEYPNIGYPPSLVALGPPENGSPEGSGAAGLVDSTLAKAATAAKQGYIYTYTPASGTPITGFSVSVSPQPGYGNRYFFLDQDGTIHYNDGAPASATSPILQ